MEKEKKNKKWLLIILLILFLLICLFLFIKFGMNKKYTITLDPDGGGEITKIEVKDGEIIKLPEEPTKDGYKFSAWVNEENNVVTKGTIITKDTKLKAVWIDEDVSTITLTFDTGGAEEIDGLIIEKNKIILLPVAPIKKGYVFAGWLNEDGNIVVEGTTITKDTKLKAIWIKNDAKIRTIVFNVDGGSAIPNIIIENGKVIIFPVNPTKIGFVFKGWVDSNGNAITKDTIINDNITIKAIWIEPYTCPSGCTPKGDGSTCTKVSATGLTTGTGCPSGYTLKNNQCLNLSKEYNANNLETSPWWSCNNGDFGYDVCSGQDANGLGGGCDRKCAPKTNKISTSVCPSGYTKEGNTCKKTETIKCTAN